MRFNVSKTKTGYMYQEFDLDGLNVEYEAFRLQNQSILELLCDVQDNYITHMGYVYR